MKIKAGIFITLIILIIICIFSLLKPQMINYNFSEFNSKLWNEYPSMRYKMIADFEQKYPAGELTESLVDELLGENNLSKTENMYSYYIGDEGFLCSYYGLLFDENGKCINRSIYRD